MGKTKIYCDDCNKEYIINYFDPTNTKCPKCKGNNIWFMEVNFDEPKVDNVILGNGGCSQK